MRKISVKERRRAMVRRHRLAADADGPEGVARAMFALHATDPASVYLSVLARSAEATLDDVADAMYERRSLVRWMAMRRTLFVFSPTDVPTVQAAVSTPLAAALRRRLISQLRRNGSQPSIEGDLDRWLADVETRIERALVLRGSATGAQLREDEPALRTLIPATAPSERPQHATAPVLTIMSTAGRLVRATPTGAWTSRHHRYEPTSRWWPDGLPTIDPLEAQRELARRWLDVFGPATVEDLQWWTGWTKTITRSALEQLAIEEVDLHGHTGLDLAERADRFDDVDVDPVATLLPALDPTPMGWKHREWLFGMDRQLLFDRAGNIGPTLWWDGEIIGSWTTAPDGDVRTRIVADRGEDARQAVDRAASRLQARLRGTVVTPAVRTPLERSLTDS